jgi:hypothetical protein
MTARGLFQNSLILDGSSASMDAIRAGIIKGTLLEIKGTLLEGFASASSIGPKRSAG